jgi:DNA-binding GntR family transcriptional regulator
MLSSDHIWAIRRANALDGRPIVKDIATRASPTVLQCQLFVQQTSGWGGAPLVQRDLAHRLGVSQTPVRLGLTELARTGLVEVGANGRALVRSLTREDLEELYAARLGLPGLAARVGAAMVGPSELDTMRSLLPELGALAEHGHLDRYLERRWQFHATCYRASGRLRLLGEVERLFWRGERYHRLALSEVEHRRRAVATCGSFWEACARGDGADADAERIIQTGLRWAVDLIAGSLPSEFEAVRT